MMVDFKYFNMALSKLIPVAGLSKTNSSAWTPTNTALSNNSKVIDGDFIAAIQTVLNYQAVGLDLGSPQIIERLILYDQTSSADAGIWTGGNHDNLSVYISNDNSTWTFVESFNPPSRAGTTSGIITMDLAIPQTARYIQVFTTDYNLYAKNGTPLVHVELEAYHYELVTILSDAQIILSTQDIVTILSNAQIVNPFAFTYANAGITADTVDTLEVNFNTINPKLKHVCSHKLSSGTYRLSNCPRCLSTGYYYDIKFNETGQLVTIPLIEQLAQILEKLAITEENKFHPEIAVNITKWLGNFSIPEIRNAIKFDLLKSLMVLQEAQKGVSNLSGEVQIGRVDSVEVYENPDDNTSAIYIIKVTSVSGVNKELSGAIIFNG
jgi:hypothetical protein